MTEVISADAVIVGGGIIGVATAERLAARKRSVVLIERSEIASGATGISGGLLRCSELVPEYRPWARSGVHIYLRRGWRGRWPAVREAGSLQLFDSGRLQEAIDQVSLVHKAALPAMLLDSREMRRRFPILLVPHGTVAVYEPQAGWLPAAELTTAMLAEATPATTILPRTRAVELLTAGDRIAGVRTADGVTVKAPTVLLAAGLASAELAAQVGVRLPLANRRIGYCLFQARGVDLRALPTVVDTRSGGWLRPWDRHTVLAGTRSSDDGADTISHSVSAAEVDRVRSSWSYYYPELAVARVVGGVTGYDAFSEFPGAVQAWPDPQGLVTAVGWNGSGFKLAPALGDYAASLMDGLIG